MLMPSPLLWPANGLLVREVSTDWRRRQAVAAATDDLGRFLIAPAVL
jgi:hypothetical protein